MGAQIVLLGYDQAQDETSLRLTLNWQAQPREAGQVIGDYRVFVHLFDPASEWIAAQFDGRPQGGTWPTPWWQAGEVVRDEVVLSLAGVPPGTYCLAVGMYGVEDKVRLPVVAASGETLPAGRLMLDEVRVPAR